MFEKFQTISGLKVNVDKTELFPMGAIRDQKEATYTDRNVKWSPEGVKVLGITITYDKRKLIDLNYEPIVSKMENIIKIWSWRKLSLFGKVTIIKSLLQSQLVYPMAVLPSPGSAFHKKIEKKTLFKYLWNGKPDKIMRSVMYSSTDEGGLNIPNVQHQEYALKIA